MKRIALLKSFFLLCVVSGVIFLFSSSVHAHTGKEQIVENYKVEITQQPLSPFVGEKVTVSFTVEDTSGKAVPNLKGTVLIKQLVINQYVGRDADTEEKIIYREAAVTDMSGNVGVEYTFSKESIYDVEFNWGVDDKESAGIELQIREPVSFFNTDEIQKRLWFLIGIGGIGALIGSIGTFLLLTTTLHPKR